VGEIFNRKGGGLKKPLEVVELKGELSSGAEDSGGFGQLFPKRGSNEGLQGGQKGKSEGTLKGGS